MLGKPPVIPKNDFSPLFSYSGHLQLADKIFPKDLKLETCFAWGLLWWG